MNITKLLRSFVRTASAHCDTEDGPAVTDGRRALETGNVNIALKWVHQGDEEEVREAFTRAAAVRDVSPEARDVADRYFLDVLIRVHRAGEGAGFNGIKPAGAHVPPQVVAADQALERGSVDPLRGLVADERWEELERRFHRAVALKGFDVDDLTAARDFMDAYVSFFKYAEGHDHAHDHAHAH
ncbi:MAG: DUF6448 family protein [Nocardioides sp.]|nr:DUF6448 family protein [Nocardioides sp.]